MADFFNVTLEYLFCLSDKKHKLEHQIEIDKTIEEFYDFFVDYQDLNSENKETLNLICGGFWRYKQMRRLNNAANSYM